VGAWITAATTERAAALARATAERTRGDPTRRLSKDDIQRIIGELSDIREVLQNANPGDKAGVYSALGLRLTYQPAQQIVRAEVNLDPNDAGVKVRVRGGIDTITQPDALTINGELRLDHGCE
jgi:hypothetical protein